MARDLTRRDLLGGRVSFETPWEPAGAQLLHDMDARRVPDKPEGDAVARIDTGACLAHLGALCSTCVERCPLPGAIGFVGTTPVIDAAVCDGCGECVRTCPAPTPAIQWVSKAGPGGR